jgi:hypothetical protein
MIGTRWKNPPAAHSETCGICHTVGCIHTMPKVTCLAEMAERLVLQRNPPEHEPPFACLDGECGLCLACRQPPPQPRKRPAEEILHEMERLAYDTRYASMDRSTGEYREIDPAVLVFCAETIRRLAGELVR